MAKTHNKHLTVQVSLGIVAIIVDLLFPQLIYEIRFWVLALAVLLIGMPHGALDHIIYYHTFPDQPHKQKRIQFYSYYTVLMALYALLWIWFPLFSFLMFLGITLYHFGQADSERFDFNPTVKKLLLYSRGLTIVGLIVYGSDPLYISEIIEVITGYNSMELITWVDNYVLVPFLLASIYPVTYVLVIGFSAVQKPSTLFHLDAIVVPLLFAIADPILAFSIYFSGWHSFNHAKTMLQYLKKKNLPVSMTWFYKKTFLLSLMSYVGLIILYFVTKAFGDENLLVALLFILISVLTLPHIFIVEMMYRKY